VLRQRPDVQVVGLVTTVNEIFGRVAMHAVREVLLQRQAAAVGLPLWRVPIPSPCSNAEYEKAMERVVASAVEQGIVGMAFGDLFLEEIRRYREAKLAGTGLEPIFPLWGLPTDALAHTMVSAGLRARITCVDPAQLPARFAGQEFDEALLAQLPPGVDPCGERGEFHTFAYEGPMFRDSVGVRGGEIVERDGFVFADLQLDSDGQVS
jgi:diphthamide synthase (EF-2-diphthine--ammonia ligase)